MPPVIAAAAAGEALAGGAAAEGAGLVSSVGGAAARARAAAGEASPASMLRVPRLPRIRSLPASRRRAAAPPPVMTWGKSAPYLIVAVIFDFLRAICEQSWLLAPIFVGAYTSGALSKWLGATIAGVVGKVVGVSAAFFTTGALLLIGPLMGMAIGFLGWLAVLMMLLVSNGRIFKENETSLLWMGAGLLVAEMPLIGTLPSISISVLSLFRTQIKKDRAAFKKWRETAAATERAAQKDALDQFLMTREVVAQRTAQEASNANQEIPEETLRAA